MCGDAIDTLQKAGATVIDLPAEKALRKNVDKSCREHPDAMLIFYDHGNEDLLMGNDGIPVIDLDNVDLLSNREVYTMACLSAKTLGVIAYVDHKCKSFWGSVDVVSLTTDAIESFKEAFNYGLIQRLKGLSWKECLESTKEKMAEIINRLIEAGKLIAATCLSYDRDILVCYDGGSPAPSICPFRNLGIKLFGRVGSRLSRKIAVSILTFGLGMGVMLGGYHEILSLQGFYFGFLAVLGSFILATYEYAQWLRK